MPTTSRVSAALLCLGASVVTYGTHSPVFASGYCGGLDTGIVSKAPSVRALPDGATMRVWHDSQMTLTQISVPASSPLGVHVWTSGAVSRSTKPTRVLNRRPAALAIMNAGPFDPARGAVPRGPEVVGGTALKAESTPYNALVIGKNGHQMGQGMVVLQGHVTAAGQHDAVTGLNWQTDTGNGVNVYTTTWGSQTMPHGSLDVVIANGVVKAVRHSNLGTPPGTGQTILTGTGNAATFLEKMKVGESVTVTYHPTYQFHYSETPFPVVDAVDHGVPYWLDGAQWPIPCDETDQHHYSRTAIGYDQSGSYFLLVASGPSRSTYGGGASRSDMQYYLHHFGSYNADGFDGDTSVTLAARFTSGGSVQRLDKTNSFYQRPVPNYLGIQ